MQKTNNQWESAAREAADLMTIAEVCRSIPGPRGKGISRSTVWRWMQKGTNGCRLPWVKIGGQRYVRRSEFERFIRMQNESQKGKTEPYPREKSCLEAEHIRRYLDAEGL